MSKQMREQENEREEAEDSDQDQGGGGMLGGNTTVSHAQGLKNRVELRGKLRVSASEAAGEYLSLYFFVYRLRRWRAGREGRKLS